jgi:hypothetical protein
MTNKITKKEMYTTIMNLLSDNDAIVAFCEHEIELLDKKAVKAKETAAKKKAAGDELTDAVASVLNDEFQTIADVTAQIEGEDVTNAKVQYRLNALVKAGAAEKAEVTLEGTDGKKARKVVAYRAI